MSFTQQIKLYNQFYSIFIYEKEDQFEDSLANHQLGVNKNKVYTSPGQNPPKES